MSVIFVMDTNCSVYEVQSEVEETVDQKITETGFVLCKVWTEVEEIIGDQNVTFKHDAW